MTQKVVTFCDGDWCEPTRKIEHGDPAEDDEWVELDVDDGPVHFCQECAYRALQWGSHGRSAGNHMAVRHNHVGESFEAAHVSPGTETDNVSQPGTHAFLIEPLTGEESAVPDRLFDRYKEYWHVHCNDHFGVSLFGEHRGNPMVVVHPEEFPTTFEIREQTAGYQFDTVRVDESIDVEWIDND